MFKVYIDAKNTGTYVSSDKSSITNIYGDWSFGNLTAGTYDVRVVPVTGLTLTTPVNGVLPITLTAGQASTGNLFGEQAVSAPAIAAVLPATTTGSVLNLADAASNPFASDLQIGSTTQIANSVLAS